MTQIKYKISKEVVVEISGHAGADRHNGADLCCAAESILAFTLAHRLGRLNLPKYKIAVSDGYMCISFGLVTAKAISALSAVYTVLCGFDLLQNKYPQNVSVGKAKEVKFNEQIYS